jgi:hypothetical protein
LYYLPWRLNGFFSRSLIGKVLTVRNAAKLSFFARLKPAPLRSDRRNFDT